MQTFLPYPSFRESARVLDRARLGKQRVEGLQLLRAVTIPTYGWQHHPATTMWRGYVPALTKYTLAMVDEWIAQGRPDTVRDQVLPFAPDVDAADQDELDLPEWIGDTEVHLSHQSNLIRKDPVFYGPLFPGVPGDLPYIWPGKRS